MVPRRLPQQHAGEAPKVDHSEPSLRHVFSCVSLGVLGYRKEKKNSFFN